MKELIEYLERKIELCTEMNMPLENFAYTDALKKARALQLQQTGVIKLVCGNCERKKLYIKKQCYCGYCGDRLKT